MIRLKLRDDGVHAVIAGRVHALPLPRLRAALAGAPGVILRGDICRPELALEIEAVCQTRGFG